MDTQRRPEGVRPGLLRRRSGAAALAVVLASMLTACTGGHTPTPTPTASATVTASATAASTAPAATPAPSGAASTPSASASPTASSAQRIDPNAPSGQCPDRQLAVTVKYDPKAAGAGQRSSWVIFRNTGSSSCVLAGAPGVSLVGHGDGTQLGAPADGSGDSSEPVTIPAGGYAGARLQYTYVDANGGDFNTGTDSAPHDPSCKAAAADGYRVYPPHSFRAWFVKYPTYACTTDRRWMFIGPVEPAGKVDVAP